MQERYKNFAKFLALVMMINVIRYVFGVPFERLLIFERLFGEMEKNPLCFNTEFTHFDWTTSYFYNFMMWLAITWVFVNMHAALTGGPMLKSFKVYGLMYLFYASLSAIYMNHYRHQQTFYTYNILGG